MCVLDRLNSPHLPAYKADKSMVWTPFFAVPSLIPKLLFLVVRASHYMLASKTDGPPKFMQLLSMYVYMSVASYGFGDEYASHPTHSAGYVFSVHL